MINERDVLSLLRFDTFDADTQSWVAWAGGLNSLDIQRGGQRSGVTTTVESGLLTATLVNTANPLTDDRVKPNVPVRVVTPYTSFADFNAQYEGQDFGDFNTLWAGKSFGQFNAAYLPLIPVFTGQVMDIASTFSFDKATGEKTRFVVFTATDAVRPHTSTKRFGAVSGVGSESWAQRIIRLSSSATTDVETPADDSPIVRYAI